MDSVHKHITNFKKTGNSVIDQTEQTKKLFDFQLDIFKKFTTLDFQQLSSNYRPLQDLNDRRVLLKVSGPLNNAADCRTTSDMIKLSVLFIVLMFIY